MSLAHRRLLLSALAVFTGLALTTPAVGALIEGSSEDSGTTLLVGFTTGISRQLVIDAGGQPLRDIPQINVLEARVEDPVAFKLTLSLNPAVAFVAPNLPLSLAGSTWDGSAWDGSAWDGTSWDGSAWDGSAWDGSAWDGSAWDGSAWDGSAWDGSAWDGSAWDGSAWDGSAWDGSAWDGSAWDGSAWDGSAWDGSAWDGSAWDWSTYDGSSWNVGTMDPGYPHQWGHGAVNSPDAWAHSMGAHNVKICVPDTGVDASHPDLQPNLFRNADGTIGYNAMTRSNGAPDDVGHGTHVIGIMAAVTANGTGIAGMAQEVVVPVKVMDANGGTEADLAHAITWCADQGADVISMSLHVTEKPETLQRALKYAYEKGVLLVASTGNDGLGDVYYPAASPYAMAVGAVKPDATVAGFSNGGKKVSVVAPGVWIASTFPGGGYASGSGTSQAVPWVAATAALMLELKPTLTPAEIAGILQSTARDVGDPGFDHRAGHGALDAGAALAMTAAFP